MSESVDTDILTERRQRLSQAKQALLERLARGGSEHQQRITRREDPQWAPVSFSQQRLWFLEQLTPGSAIYNMHDAARIQGRMAIEDMRQVLETLVRRHEVLRTTFRMVDGVPMQFVSTDDAPFELPVEDLRSMAPARRWEHAHRLAIEETQRPFDLAVGPLFRARVIRVEDEDALLIWTMHHAVSDGWSLGVIIREVLAMSIARTNGEDNPLEPLQIQYGDYAQWQRKWLDSAQIQKQLDYWRKALDGDIPAVSLPTDHPRPTFPTYAGGRVVRVFPVELREALKNLASQNGATLFMVMLATFDVLLHRYTGMDRIFVGTPVANRNSRELESLIGFFVNTLVLGSDFSHKPNFVELLAQVRQTALKAYENQDIPFERLVEVLQPHRETNRPPFFQVMFVLQNEPMPEAVLPGLKIAPYEIHNGTSKFDLLINVFEEADGLNVGIEYSSDIFERDTIERMLGHYQTLLESVVHNPACPVLELPMLGAGERQWILEEFNDTEVDYADSRPHLLHELITRQSARTPERIAFSFGERSFSHEEMNRRANHLAHRLRALGAAPNTIVGICAERSSELVIGLLGILKSGAAYLPLDRDYPPDRLRFMFEESRANILLHTGSRPEWADAADTCCIALSVLEEPDPALTADPEVTNGENDLAYVIYTSGSTGRPKGAANTHRGICNRLLWMQDTYRLTSADCVLQKTPFSFDVSVWEFFWPLMTEARLVVAPPGAHRDSSQLAAIIVHERISVLHFVPSMLAIFLQDPASAQCRSLRAVICSGEALPPTVRDDFLTRFDCELHNLYGPTEAAVDVTAWDCRNEHSGTTVPIGKPIANTRIYILDERMQPVPVGVAGELYIGGTNVGAGYLHREALTRERFVDDPFCHGQTLYRSGDLARHDRNGVIEYVGRVDHQVKIRGLRIELSEIEHALVKDPEVGAAVVLAREDTPGDTRLAAYLVTQSAPANADGKDDGVIDEWQMVFDEAYAAGRTETENAEPDPAPAGGPTRLQDGDGSGNGAGTVDPDADYAGWVSSYTGEDIPTEQMREWVDVTIDRLKALKPRRILEIGCGTGLLLFRLLEDVDRYVGTDISATGLRSVRARLDAAGVDKDRVALHPLAAHQLDQLEEGGFDLIIMNSVVQYFPEVDYLLRVLDMCHSRLAPGGRIFLGDLRNNRLMKTFAASVTVHRAADDDDVITLHERMQRNLAQERELALDPRLMDWLCQTAPHFTHAGVWLRRGRHDTEMCRYRFDALLETSPPQPLPGPIVTVDWAETGSIDALKKRVADIDGNAALLVRGIPNARLLNDSCVRQALETLGANADPEPKPACKRELLELATGLITRAGEAIDPEQLCRELAPFGSSHVGWTAAAAGDEDEENHPGGAGSGAFDLLVAPPSWPAAQAAAALPRPAALPAAPPGRYASQPGRQDRESAIRRRLDEQLRQSLPDYMLPAAYVFIDAFPLLTNGKIDRKALPAPERSGDTRASTYLPPETMLESALAEVWSSVLGLARIGVDEDFFVLGGHSLLAAQMVLLLREKLGREVPLRYLFLAPTIRGMAVMIEQGASEPEGSETLWARMQRDAVLPASIVAPGKARPMSDATRVLLTGSTGFLGAFVLRELLTRTSVQVVCLVRAQDSAGGMQRLEEALQRYGLCDDVDLSRVEVVVGDLASPSLGLDADTHAGLASVLDAIFHCAAHVNFVLSYDQLAAANVGGTRALIELACSHHTKHFHLVSTIYTLTPADADGPGPLGEDLPARHGERLQMGYLQSKWVSERMAEAARDRGVPVVIHRPGRISGDSRSGACQQDDFYWNLVRACLLIGGIPEQGFDEILTPVDRVAAAIVGISFSSDKQMHAWHPMAGDMVSVSMLVQSLRRAGYDLDVLEGDEWRTRAMDVARRMPNDPASRLAGFLFNDSNAADRIEEPVFDSSMTRSAAQAVGVDLIPVNDAMLDLVVAHYQSTGFFPSVNSCRSAQVGAAAESGRT